MPFGHMPSALIIGLGVLLVLVVLQDAFEVMLLPRRVQRRMRLVRFYFKLSWKGWRAVATTLPPGQRREGFLGGYGALSMVVLFGLWATLLILGFGVIQLGAEALGGVRTTLLDQVYLSGATFFTLGYGDITPKTALARGLAVMEAGIGLGFLAAVIGYLPVLYQQFSRREAHVIQLDGRAGTPPTACTLICRHVESGGLDKLEDLLAEWERWGAELLESHLAYPMLAFYRSQHDDHSWLGGLAAVMDACALILVGGGGMKPLQARMTFAMARHVVVEMGRSLHVSPVRLTEDRLPHDSYARVENLFEDTAFGWIGGEEAEETLMALRTTYEPMLHALAQHLLIPLPPWIVEAGEGGADHWRQGRRGEIASRLIETLADRTEADAAPLGDAPEGSTPAARLRERLRR